MAAETISEFLLINIPVLSFVGTGHWTLDTEEMDNVLWGSHNFLIITLHDRQCHILSHSILRNWSQRAFGRLGAVCSNHIVLQVVYYFAMLYHRCHKASNLRIVIISSKLTFKVGMFSFDSFNSFWYCQGTIFAKKKSLKECKLVKVTEYNISCHTTTLWICYSQTSDQAPWIFHSQESWSMM